MTEEEDIEDNDSFDGVETAEVDSETAEQAVQDTSPANETEQPIAQQVDWNHVVENLENITDLISEYFEQSRENLKVQNEARIKFYQHRRWIIYTAAGVFLAVVAGSAWMTIEGALSDDAFTFILGTLFGAILTFLQNMLSSSHNEEQA